MVQENKAMTQGEADFEFQQAQAFFGGGNPKAGHLVETKTGIIGRTYHKDAPVNGKIPVYTDKGNLLCDPESLKVTGFID